MRSLFASLTLLVVASAVPVATAQKIQLSVDVSKPGPKIDRNLFGQFAEHLGHGVYGGIWVGPDLAMVHYGTGGTSGFTSGPYSGHNFATARLWP